MTIQHPTQFIAPPITFDDTVQGKLPSLVPQGNVGANPLRPGAALPSASPFNGYERSRSSEGGILIRYRDAARGGSISAMRAGVWACLAGAAINFLATFEWSSVLIDAFTSLTVPVCGAIYVSRRLMMPRSIEVRRHCLVIDGKDYFLASEIGENWPQLVFKNEIGDRAVIAGLCGSRYIEYTSVNRADSNDLTPELLEWHLNDAMEQLWGRVELAFDTENVD